MARYRKKPVVIDAWQLDGSKEHLAAILRLSTDISILPEAPDGTYALSIATLEGRMIARPYDYVIRGIEGEVYPCKATTFEAMYERVEDDA